jgi:hypothetical protein
LKLQANLFDHRGRGSDWGGSGGLEALVSEDPMGVRRSSSAKGWACGKRLTGQTRAALFGLVVTAGFEGLLGAGGKRLTARFLPHKRPLC